MWSRTTAFEVKSTKRLQLHLSAVRTVHNANHRYAPKRPSGCTAPGQSITTVPLPWKRSQLFPDNEIAPLLRKHAGFLEHESRVSDSDPAVIRAAINQPRSGPSPLRPASEADTRLAGFTTSLRSIDPAGAGFTRDEQQVSSYTCWWRTRPPATDTPTTYYPRAGSAGSMVIAHSRHPPALSCRGSPLR